MGTIFAIVLVGLIIAIAIMALGPIVMALLPFVIGVWLITSIFSGNVAIVLGLIFVVWLALRRA